MKKPEQQVSLVSMRESEFIGKVTTAPELRKTDGGTSVLNLEIRIRERKGETWEDHYFNLTCFGHHAERIARQAKPGSTIWAKCKPENRTYTNKSGQQRKSQDHLVSWIRVCLDDEAEAQTA